MTLDKFNMPERNLEPPYESLAEETARLNAIKNRVETIEATRDQLLDLLEVDADEVYEWDGDGPKDVEDPDYADDEKVFFYRRSAYVRVTLKGGRVYYFEDGWSLPRFESRITEIKEATR